MSGISEHSEQDDGRATSVEERASVWLIQRHDEKGWSDADQAKLDMWLAESPANMIAYWRLESVLDRSRRLRALHPTIKQVAPNFWARFYKLVGALVVVFAISGTAALYSFYSPETIYATAVGGREAITLADGTQIEMNTDTVLRARIGRYRRMIFLDKGEAYFQVKHDADRQFVVAASGHRLTDIGTKFLVRSGPNKFEVSVLEGQVEFESQDGRLRQPLFLGAGDVATGAENKIYVVNRPKSELATKLGWQRGVLIFDHTTLAEAAAEFNRYNREKILIADRHAGQRLIGGTFPAGDVGAFTRLAHEVLGLHVENSGIDTVISR